MTTKEKLMAAALELFQKNGFDNTSTASIAKHAWFASGTLFVHFSSKGDLLEHMYISIKKESHSYVFSNLDRTLSTEELLKQTYYRTFEYYTKNYQKLIFIEQFMNSPHIHKINMQEISTEMDEYEDILERAKDEKIIANRENELLSAAITGLFFSLSKYIKSSWADRTEDCVKMIMNALR